MFVHVQVFNSTLYICERVDIGSTVIGNLHIKDHCVELRLSEVQDLLLRLHETQLSMLNYSLRLQNSIDCIALDVPVIRLLLGEFPPSPTFSPLCSPRGFLIEVHDAMNVSGRDSSLVPSQAMLEDQDVKDTKALCFTQLRKDMQLLASHVISPPTPLSPNMLLLATHPINPCNSSDLHKGLGEGPWFAKTFVLMLSSGPPMTSAIVTPVHKLQCVIPPTFILQVKTLLCPIEKSMQKTSKTLKPATRSAYHMKWIRFKQHLHAESFQRLLNDKGQGAKRTSFIGGGGQDF